MPDTPEQDGWTDERDRAPEPEDTNAEPEDTNAEPEDTNAEPEDTNAEPEARESDDDTELPTEVRELRTEAGKYRRQRNEQRQRAESVSRRLFVELVRSTGLMIDPEDMPYSAKLVDDSEALNAAVSKHVEAKPYLKARQFPDMGQHERGRSQPPSLGSILRQHA